MGFAGDLPYFFSVFSSDFDRGFSAPGFVCLCLASKLKY